MPTHKNGLALVAGERDEGVVLASGGNVDGLEPVGEVGGALLDGPVLHGVGNHVGDDRRQLARLADAGLELLVDALGHALLHLGMGEDVDGPILGPPVVPVVAILINKIKTKIKIKIKIKTTKLKNELRV